MFNFFSDVKKRLTSLEQKVEALFSHIHTELANKVATVDTTTVKVAAAVEAEVAEVPKEAVADAAAEVEKAV